ncbi:aquaporin-like protein [Hyaloraphidium curvatum]|nr:aquaporin-like protein [Hyaloraphidium curvatum]
MADQLEPAEAGGGGGRRPSFSTPTDVPLKQSGYAQDDVKDLRLDLYRAQGRTTIVDQYGAKDGAVAQRMAAAEPVGDGKDGPAMPLSPLPAGTMPPEADERRPSAAPTAYSHYRGWLRFRMDYKGYFGEAIGMAVTIALALSAVAQVELAGGEKGGILSVAFGFGFAFMFGIIVCGGVSGGHLNPAVTIVLATFRGFPWRNVPGYILAQTVGAFIGAAVVYLIYYPAFAAFDNGCYGVPNTNTCSKASAGVFGTYPPPPFSWYSGFINEFVGTAILVTIVFATADSKNAPPTAYGALAVGFLVFQMVNSFNWVSGPALNPARDFGPRCFSAIIYGSAVFSSTSYYFWVPIVAPVLGGLFGAGLYDFGLMQDIAPTSPAMYEFIP